MILLAQLFIGLLVLFALTLTALVAFCLVMHLIISLIDDLRDLRGKG